LPFAALWILLLLLLLTSEKNTMNWNKLVGISKAYSYMVKAPLALEAVDRAQTDRRKMGTKKIF